MKIIFLDIDGVMNNAPLLRAHGLDTIGEEQLSLLKTIVVATDAKIVLSSMWRLLRENRDMVVRALARHDMELLDRTPDRFNAPRYIEIKEWLDNNPGVERFAILDDDRDAGHTLEHSYFPTDFEIGLTPEIAEKVVEHFNGVTRRTVVANASLLCNLGLAV